MSRVPSRFSVAAVAQEIPSATIAEIDEFIRVFDRVTGRRRWQRAVTAGVPALARMPRSEVCFFSAFDFHLPPDASQRFQLIEFNDNGSGLVFAALINHHFYRLSGMAERARVEPPPSPAAFLERLVAGVEAEARAFFGEPLAGLILILDDEDSLEQGRFRDELVLQRDAFRARGWPAEIGTPPQLRFDGGELRCGDLAVQFVVNRSTDFFFEGDAFEALRAAYRGGRVYVAPNPFSYATRSDKRLLALLSRPDRDAELGIRPEERAVLSAHVPETWLVDEDDLEALVRRKQELVFKPAHGHASRGLLPSAQVGRSRLRRLARKGVQYVAQRRVPKHPLTAPGSAGPLFADLRVWAHSRGERAERIALSGRASRDPDGLDLRSPGGWLPTYAQAPVRL